MQMSGGLGNQMFQYALSLSLENRGREVLWDDVTEYPDVKQLENGSIVRPRMLERTFGIQVRRASETQIRTMRDLNMRLSDRVLRKVRGRRGTEYRDDDFCYDSRFLEYETGYFLGCFQSEKYFADVRQKVADAFAFSEELLQDHPEAEAAARQIREEKAPAAIHLRFGDYLTKADLYGGICTDAYYERAIQVLLEREPDTVFYVFSNDEALAEEWIERHKEQARFVPVKGNDEEHGYIDLYLMHLCRNFIIANSSFSWWGAWLGKYRKNASRNPLIIAPSVWMRFPDGSQLRRTDIYTDDMIRISGQGLVVHTPDLQSAGTDTPKVSVIVAAYNIERYIARALDSLCAQTYQNLEIIAVDDGSSDETGIICDRYAEKDSRVRVIHKQNGGLSDARNAGLEIASGDYIGYLDGDDWAEPQMFGVMVTACMQSGADMAMIGYRSASENEQPEWTEKRPESAQEDPDKGQLAKKSEETPAFGGSVTDAILRRSTVLDRHQALKAYILSGISTDLTKTPFYNSVWSKLYSADIVEGERFPTGKNSEDILYTTKALMACRTACYIPEPLYNYVENRSGSIMNQKTGERRVNDEMPFWQEQIRLLDTEKDRNLCELARFAYYRRLLYYENEMRKDPALVSYADEMQRLLEQDRQTALTVVRNIKGQKRGDRVRIGTFLRSPGLYRVLDAIYEKTWIAMHRNGAE